MLWKQIFAALSPPGNASRLSVLIFHRVLREKDPLLPFEPDGDEFEERLRWVRQWFNVLSLVDAVRRLKEGTLPARPMCITFDDGYANNADIALPILLRVGLKATFFIATAFLDGGRMWNDTVIESIRRCKSQDLDLSDLGLGVHPLRSISERMRAIDDLLPRLKYLPPDKRDQTAAAIGTIAKAALPSDLMMASAQVKALGDAGMTLGAHTDSHPILTVIDEPDVEREIVVGRRKLEAVAQSPVTLFAYPNGQPEKDYSMQHVKLVRRLGFEGAVSTAPGVAIASSDAFQIPRFTPWDRTRLRYGARLAQNLRADAQAFQLH